MNAFLIEHARNGTGFDNNLGLRTYDLEAEADLKH